MISQTAQWKVKALYFSAFSRKILIIIINFSKRIAEIQHCLVITFQSRLQKWEVFKSKTILTKWVGKTKSEQHRNDRLKAWSKLKLQQNWKRENRYSTNNFFSSVIWVSLCYFKSLFFFPHFLLKLLQPKQQQLFISHEAADGIKMPFPKPQNKPGPCPAVSKVVLINDGQVTVPFCEQTVRAKGIITF